MVRSHVVRPEHPRDVLRALRAALGGAGPALMLGGGHGTEPDSAPDHADLPAGAVAVITTSGSSGYPKSVVLGRAALTSSALATFARIGEGAWLLALPATYVAGLQVLVRSLVAGREPAVLAGAFTPAAFTAAARTMVSSEGGTRVPTFTSLVPAQLATLLDAADEDADVGAALRSFESILVGGQSLPDTLRARAEDAGARIVRTYGSSETSGGCVYDGVPLEGVSVRSDAGEILIAGPVLAEGYLGEPERTAAAFWRDADGVRWYRSGDVGSVEDGVLRVTGRADNVIVSGGVNVSLDRVEHVVRAQTGLSGAVVVGVPDERWGEVPVVVVAREASAEAYDLDELRTIVGTQLGVAGRPAALIEVDELPVLASGKPDRVTLRGWAMQRR